MSSSSARNAGSRMAAVERRFELVERGDERLGDVAAAEGAKSIVGCDELRRVVVRCHDASSLPARPRVTADAAPAANARMS
jgi:hypothetical protein